MRNIDELLKQEKKPAPVKSEDELLQEWYLKEIEDMKDFRPEAKRITYPTPVRPQWKN